MARSYKSALPTWSTYTPHVSPLGIQAPVNQETIWRNRARQFSPAGIHGEMNRAMLGIQAQVKGTGAGYAAVQTVGHTPLIDAAQGFANQRRDAQRTWAAHMQDSLQRQAPEDMVAPGEAPPQEETQVRAARTAPDTVNPADVQTQDAARGSAEQMVGGVLRSKRSGPSTIPVSMTQSGIFVPTRGR